MMGPSPGCGREAGAVRPVAPMGRRPAVPGRSGEVTPGAGDRMGCGDVVGPYRPADGRHRPAV